MKYHLLIFLLIPCFAFSQDWVQLGSDIDGEAAGDNSGKAVSLSSDGSIVAIGAWMNNGNGKQSGHVRVYGWNGSAWVQRGSDIDGEAADDHSGISVSLSSDGTIVAIGAYTNDGNDNNSGHVRVYKWNGSSWVQKGSDLDGDAFSDNHGISVSLSSDGTIVAIGSSQIFNDSGAGYVRVYEWDGSAWVQRGDDINGEAAGDNSGYAVSLSSDGTIVAIGAPQNRNRRGHVRVYEWDGSAWVQRGIEIDGEASGDYSGIAVSLSSDGTIVAIGAPNNAGGLGGGHVRVFEWNGTTWSQVGSDLDGKWGGEFGASVALNDDGKFISVGSPHFSKGLTEVFQYVDGYWKSMAYLAGEGSFDYSGNATAISGNGSIVVTSSSFNDGDVSNNFTEDIGHVRVFKSDDVVPDDILVTLNIESGGSFVKTDTIKESESIDIYIVLTERPNAQDITVNLSFSGTASDSDYSITSTSMTVPYSTLNSYTMAYVSVTANADDEIEANETLIVDIESVNNGVENETQQVIITIESDADNDGISDDIDICPETSNGESVDDNGCSDSQRDTDKDGILDVDDNCPVVYNPNQTDINKNDIGDICEDFEEPQTVNIVVENIEYEETFNQIVSQYIIDDNYQFFFNQGSDVIDIDNDGKQEFVSLFYETTREINKAGIGVFSFDLNENDKIKINLDKVINIYGEPNANAPEVAHLNKDELYDIFIPTGGFHGEPGDQPDFYNGTTNRPDFIFYNTGDGFEVDSLDFTYDNLKYAGTHYQKQVQIDSDNEKEIILMSQNNAMDGYGGIVIYDFINNRHELSKEIKSNYPRVSDVLDIDYSNNGNNDLLVISNQKESSYNNYFLQIYYGNNDGVDFNNDISNIGSFSVDSEWFVPENEDGFKFIEIDNLRILLVWFANTNGNDSKLKAYEISTSNIVDVTEYLFGKKFTERRFDGLGPILSDFDSDGDLDFITEGGYSAENPYILYLNNGLRFQPVLFSESNLGNRFIDLNQDGILDIISDKSSSAQIVNTINNPSDIDFDGIINSLDDDDDGDGVPDTEDNCPLTANGDQLDTDGDGDGDVCDTDDDGDGVPDTEDNCPLTANADQADWNNNGIGDLCGDPRPLFTEDVTLVEKIYPNPTSDILKVTIKPELKILDIYFVDFSGMFIKPRLITRSDDILEINVSNLKVGIYIMEIISQNETTKIKVVIER